MTFVVKFVRSLAHRIELSGLVSGIMEAKNRFDSEEFMLF